VDRVLEAGNAWYRRRRPHACRSLRLLGDVGVRRVAIADRSILLADLRCWVVLESSELIKSKTQDGKATRYLYASGASMLPCTYLHFGVSLKTVTETKATRLSSEVPYPLHWTE
jgi:hypothetical protein